MKELVGLLAPIAIILILYLSLQNWRNSVKAVLVLLVIEGALRKWLLPEASQFIYFLKDIVVIGAYLRYYFFLPSESTFRIKGNQVAEAVISMILLVAVWCVFQVFNPSLGSPIIGIFGLRGYLLYIPLLWMLPNLFRSEDELYRFLRSYLLLVIPVGILAVLQYFSPPSSPLNVYTQDLVKLDAALLDRTSVRVTGTFSYIAGYGAYALVSFGLVLPLLTLKQSLWWRWATIVELLLIVSTSLMNGSRALVGSEILFLIGYIGGQLLTNPYTIISLIKQFSLPAIAITTAAIIGFQSAINGFQNRVTSNKDVSGRIGLLYTEPIEFMQLKGLDSYGVGATHQATPALRSALNLPVGENIPVFYESEPGRVMLDLGPLGFLLWYLLRLSLIFLLLQTFLKLKRPFLRQLALSAFLIHATQFTAQVVINHTLLVYYWFLAGFIFLLPRLEEIENKKQQEFLQQYNVSATYFPDTSYR